MGRQITFSALDPDAAPSSIEEAVEMLIDLDPSKISKILGRATIGERIRINDSITPDIVHHSLGQYIRNLWSLWNHDTPIKHDAVKQYRIAHADDISSFILNWAWARIRNEDFNPQGFVKRYHKHWQNEGTDAITAGGYNTQGFALPLKHTSPA